MPSFAYCRHVLNALTDVNVHAPSKKLQRIKAQLYRL